MGREAEMADVGALREPRCDHPPADRPLQSDKRRQREQPPAIARRNHAPPRIENERHEQRQPDQPAEDAVEPFPEEDRLERRKRHAEVDLPRSEEHTSELQSLMRISYAVFCFKKKN